MFGNTLKMLFSTTTPTKPTTTQQENHQNITTHATTATTTKSEIKERVKNQNHKQILLQKFQTRTRTNRCEWVRQGSSVRVGLRCEWVRRCKWVRRREWVRGASGFVGVRRCEWVRGATISLLSLSLSSHVVWKW